jgi:hypothetical protein
MNSTVQKSFVIIVCFIFFIGCSEKPPARSPNYFKDTYIIWKNSEQLHWSDFKGDRVLLNKDNSVAIAATHWSIMYYFYQQRQWVICATFDRTKSWCLGGQATESILKHEQYHFNIAEVYARKIRKATAEQNIAIQTGAYSKIFNAIVNDCRLAQIAYDKATLHGVDLKEQQHWQHDIDEKLNELAAWSNASLFTGQ